MERELFGLLLDAARGLEGARRRPVRGAYVDPDILAVLLWAALNDRPISWATRRGNWPLCLHRRALPTPSTMSRRLRNPSVTRLLGALIRALHVRGEGERSLVIDGRPLTITRHSADPDAGFGRAAGGLGKGYKLNEIVDLLGNCRSFRVEPLNVSEQAAAREMIGQLDPGEADELLADANYDSNALYELAGQRGVQMIADRRYKRARGIGHHSHSRYRLTAIGLLATRPAVLARRRVVEGCFGTQGNIVGGLGPLPNFVRRLARVRLWVAAKLAIDAAHRRERFTQRMA
jgi:hypothetical protein